MENNKAVLLIGALDTKGAEVAYLKDLVARNNVKPVVVDIGVFNPSFQPDVTNEEVAKAGGLSIEEVRRLNEYEAMRVMARGLTAVVKRLYSQGKFDGVIAIGGGMGAATAAEALRELPIGVPKVLVSTMMVVQAGLKWYVDGRDIVFFPCPVDIIGLNRATKRVLANAAYAISNMVKARVEHREKPLVAATALGSINKLASTVSRLLEEKGFEVVVFHAVGLGGAAFERFIEEEELVGVLDLSLNELSCELFGGLYLAGPRRLETAGDKGIPQVVVPGNVDFLCFLRPETVPAHYRNRKVHQHNPQSTIVELNKEEAEKLAKVIAGKLNRAKGPTSVIIPMKGFSAFDKEDGIYWDPERDAAFVRALEENLRKDIEVLKVDSHINDEDFAKVVAEKFVQLVGVVIGS